MSPVSHGISQTYPRSRMFTSPNRQVQDKLVLCAALIPMTVCVLMTSLRHLSGPLFIGGDNLWVQGWIDTCRTRATIDNPDPGNPATAGQAIVLTGTGIDESATCSTFLRCVLSQATDDFPTYWSAAASILALIPTIVGLLSNSIDEIVAVADESTILALFLALSTTVSFSSRFTDSQAPQIFEHNPGYVLAAEKQIVRAVQEEFRQNNESQSKSWYRNPTMHMTAAITLLLIAAGGIWYSVWVLARYGIVVWSCSNKFHTALWVALSQVLIIINIALRSLVFHTERIKLRVPNHTSSNYVSRKAQSSTHKPADDQISMLQRRKSPAGETTSEITIVLRCRRGGWKRWCIQTISSIVSYGLYTFSTVILASMALIWPPDAVYIMVAFSAAGGVGRLVGYWASSSLRLGKGIATFEVPSVHMRDVKETLQNRQDWREADIELAAIDH